MKKSQARTGKIAALPESIRNELNRRLLDGELSTTLLPWLNQHPTVKLILDERFEAAPITPDNLSHWRNGGYKDWLNSSERLQQVKSLSDYAAKLARENGGTLAEGAQAIVGGRILAVLEKTGGTMAAEELKELVQCLTGIRVTEIAQQRADQQAVKLKQSEEQLKLEREKFEIVVCRKLLDEAKQKRAQEIANSSLDNEAKINALRQVYFADVDELEKSGEVQLPK